MCESHRAELAKCTACEGAAAEAWRVDNPRLRMDAARARVARAIDELKRLGCPESKTSTYLTTEQKLLRGWVEVEHPGLRYWPVGSFRWSWSEGGSGDGYGAVEREGTRDTFINENATIYRDADLANLARDFNPSGFMPWEDLTPNLSEIADRLERILARTRRL
jgi:hypothetical protein